MDSTDVLNKLRQKHAQEGDEGTWFGVDVINGTINNMYKQFVWEPEVVRINVITAASEAACTILSVDQTIKNPKSEQAQAEVEKRMIAQAGGGGGGRGRGGPPMGRGMRGRGGR